MRLRPLLILAVGETRDRWLSSALPTSSWPLSGVQERGSAGMFALGPPRRSCVRGDVAGGPPNGGSRLGRSVGIGRPMTAITHSWTVRGGAQRASAIRRKRTFQPAGSGRSSPPPTTRFAFLVRSTPFIAG